MSPRRFFSGYDKFSTNGVDGVNIFLNLLWFVWRPEQVSLDWKKKYQWGLKDFIWFWKTFTFIQKRRKNLCIQQNFNKYQLFHSYLATERQEIRLPNFRWKVNQHSTENQCPSLKIILVCSIPTSAGYS